MKRVDRGCNDSKRLEDAIAICSVAYVLSIPLNQQPQPAQPVSSSSSPAHDSHRSPLDTCFSHPASPAEHPVRPELHTASEAASQMRDPSQRSDVDRILEPSSRRPRTWPACLGRFRLVVARCMLYQDGPNVLWSCRVCLRCLVVPDRLGSGPIWSPSWLLRWLMISCRAYLHGSRFLGSIFESTGHIDMPGSLDLLSLPLLQDSLGARNI